MSEPQSPYLLNLQQYPKAREAQMSEASMSEPRTAAQMLRIWRAELQGLRARLHVLSGPYHGSERYSAPYNTGWAQCALEYVTPVLDDLLNDGPLEDPWEEIARLEEEVRSLRAVAGDAPERKANIWNSSE